MSRSASDLRILVVDDSKTIRKTAELLLGKEEFRVETAEDGFEALSKIAEFAPDLVFVDIMMPRLDGYQACALVKNNPKYQALPVVMLSSKDGLFDQARGHIVGADQYVTKPFTRDDLMTALRSAIPDLAA